MRNLNNRVEFANTLRGIAALCVLISHYFGVFWLARKAVITFTYASILPLETFPTPCYVQWLNSIKHFDFGAFGVAIFFLISGFIIPISLQKQNWQEFAVNRLFRILPTYAFGFSVTLIAIFISCIYFHISFPLRAKEIFIHYFPGLHDVMHFSNIDGVIWTLEIEMKFYVLCALLSLWFRQGKQYIFAMPIAIAILAVLSRHTLLALSSNPPSIAFNILYSFVFTAPFIIFMFIGVVFNYVYRNLLTTRTAILLVMLFASSAILVVKYSLFYDELKSVLSYGIALICFYLAFKFQHFFQGNIITNVLANISYPLYIVHGIAGYVLLRILLDRGFSEIIALILTVGAAVTTALILHYLIERPSQRLGKWLAKRWFGDEINVQRANNIRAALQ